MKSMKNSGDSKTDSTSHKKTKQKLGSLELAAVLAVLAVFLGLSFLWYVNANDITDDNLLNSSQSEYNLPDEVAPNPNPSSSFKEDDQNVPSDQNEQQGEDNNSENTGSGATNNVQISSAQQSDSGNVVVKTKLLGVSGGECSLTMTKGAEIIVKKAEVVFAQDFSICAGFEIEGSELSPGEWTVDLSVKNAGTIQEAERKTVVVK